MDRDYSQLNSDYVTSDVLPAVEYDALVGILDRQLHGALQGIGDGVITGGAVTGGGGLTCNVSALRAILDSSEGYIYLQTTAGVALSDLPPSSTVYVHGGASITGGADDSQVTAAVTVFWSYSDVEADAVLLAEVVTGPATVTSITDNRAFVTAEEALQATAALQALAATTQTAIGAEYFGGSPPSDSLHSRVSVLEGGYGGPGGTIYWGSMWRGAGDLTTVDQQIDSDIAEHVTDYHGGGATGGIPGTNIEVAEWDVEAANHARMLLRATRQTDADLPRYMRDCIVVVHGVFGDGTGDYDFVDHDNTTWEYVAP